MSFMLMRRVALVACILMLGGCTWVSKKMNQHDDDYLKQSDTIASTRIPSGVKTEPMESYYPVPAGESTGTAAPPSVVPPGSAIQTSEQEVKQGTDLVAESPDILFIKAPPASAWPKVASALKASDLTVLDQDQGMGAYFILDKVQTHHQVTKETPILRVNLQPQEGGTLVSVASQENKPLPPVVEQRIIDTLKKYLG